MELVVGTDSTWSLRAWMCVQIIGLDIKENVIDLTSRHYKAELLKYSPTGLVPTLIDEAVIVHDSLAIAEYLNEKFPGKLYPSDLKQRAVARSLCAELHSGFAQLRKNYPFSLNKVTKPSSIDKQTTAELSRVEAVFYQAKLPFMYDSAGVVDAFYAVLAFRLNSYGISFEGSAGDYQKILLSWPILLSAIAQAKLWQVKR